MLSSGVPTKRKIAAKKIQLVIVEKKTKSKIPFVYLPRMYLSTKLDEAQNSGASNERKIQFILFNQIFNCDIKSFRDFAHHKDRWFFNNTSFNFGKRCISHICLSSKIILRKPQFLPQFPYLQS